MIYFPCANTDEPTGGVRTLYRHVDILNANGLPAAIAHERPPFRCSWFENSTRIVYLSQQPIAPTDVIGIPELWAWQIDSVGVGVPKVIYNQNAYLSFKALPQGAELVKAYTHRDLVAVVCCSADTEQYVKFAFPDVRTLRFRYSIDPAIFSYTSEKRKMLAFMPRKLAEQAKQVLELLKIRGALRGWEVKAIEGMNEREVAAILREAAVFLSFAHLEGFGLPAAEAMACGCVVVGYHGNGGRELFLPQHSFPVAAEDVMGFAQAAERVLAMSDGERMTIGQRASQFIIANYSPQQETADVLAAWGQILEMIRARAK